MKIELKIFLDEKQRQRLQEICGDDETAMRDFVIKALERELDAPRSEPRKGLDTSGLDDYLQKGDPGSRSYGAKGQGW